MKTDKRIDELEFIVNKMLKKQEYIETELIKLMYPVNCESVDKLEKEINLLITQNTMWRFYSEELGLLKKRLNEIYAELGKNVCNKENRRVGG